MRVSFFLVWGAVTALAFRPILPRPNLYFGTTTRSTTPLQVGYFWESVCFEGLDMVFYGCLQSGLMWLYGGLQKPRGSSSRAGLRHEATKEDGVEHWGWNWHDGRGFGVSNITDTGSHMDGHFVYVADSRGLTSRVVAPGPIAEGSGKVGEVEQVEGGVLVDGLGDSEFSSGSGSLLRVGAHGTCVGPRRLLHRPLSLFYYLVVSNGSVGVDVERSGFVGGGDVGGAMEYEAGVGDGVSGRLVLKGVSGEEEEFVVGVEGGKGVEEDGGKFLWKRDEEGGSKFGGWSDRDDGRDLEDVGEKDWMSKMHVLGVRIEEEGELWRTKELVEEFLKRSETRASKMRKAAAKKWADEHDGDFKGARARVGKQQLVPLLPDYVEKDANVLIVQVLQPVCDWNLGAVHVDGELLEKADEVLFGEEVSLEKSVDARIALWEERFDAVFGPVLAPWEEVGEETVEVEATRSVFDMVRDFVMPSATPEPTVEDALRPEPPGDEEGRKRWKARARELSRFALSNLLGSVTFYHGSQLVGDPHERPHGGRPKVPEESKPHSLLTGCPARSFFPRGFLWDEGFHLLLLSPWDPMLGADILAHWLSSMDAHGWIAREQILGPEARSRVPGQFQTQHPDVANPPTLFLATRELVDVWSDERRTKIFAQYRQKAEALDWNDIKHLFPSNSQSKPFDVSAAASKMNQQATKNLLQALLPSLHRHLKWLQTSQAGPKPNSFRWRGTKPEEPDHTFASGLDDTPRGVYHTHGDQHVDLLSWISFAALLLDDLEGRSRHADDALIEALDEHWDDSNQFFCDLAVPKWPTQQQIEEMNRDPRNLVQLVDRSCHVSYIGLFPATLHILNGSDPRLGHLLNAMQDPERLWSHVGIRSLSRSDKLYRSKEDYWRGAIWINVNFLLLRSLRRYAHSTSPFAAQARTMERNLRSNLAINLVQQWTGPDQNVGLYDGPPAAKLWENYDPTDGHGRGVQPFTGWSALAVRILTAEY